MSCGVGRRCGSDLCVAMAVAMAVVQIQPLAWELPYATSSALKRQKPTNQPTNQTKSSAFLLFQKLVSTYITIIQRIIIWGGCDIKNRFKTIRTRPCLFQITKFSIISWLHGTFSLHELEFSENSCLGRKAYHEILRFLTCLTS